MSAPLKSTESAKDALGRVRYSHDALIDYILVNPQATQNEIAKAFGYTVPWISRIMCSDAFLARLAERKEDLVDPMIISSLEDKMHGAVARSFDILIEKLDQPHIANSQMGTELALKVADLGGKLLGYGARADKTPAVQQNFVVLTPGKNASAAEWAQQYGTKLAAGSESPTAKVIDQE